MPPPLHAALTCGNRLRQPTELVACLLASPLVDVNARDYRFGIKGLPAIMKVVDLCYDQVLDLLLAVPTLNVNATNDNGHSLCVAAFYAHAGMLASLLGHPDIDVNFTADHFSDSALHEAARARAPAAVRALLDHPDTDAALTIEYSNETPLHTAAAMGPYDSVALLLARPEFQIQDPARPGKAKSRKKKTSGQPWPDHLNQRNQYGQTALHKACFNGQVAVVKMLLACPGIITDGKDKEGWTLRMSAEKGRTHSRRDPHEYGGAFEHAGVLDVLAQHGL